jgi:hypothetical protein
MDCLVTQNVVDLFGDPSSDGKLVTQAISGARVTVRHEQEDFSFVDLEDRYQGWIATERLTPAWDDTDYLKTSIATLLADVFTEPNPAGEMLTKLVVGSKVTVAHRPESGDYVPILLPDRQLGYIHRLCLNMTHEGPGGGPDLIDEKARRALDITALKRRVIEAVGQQAVSVGKRLIGTPYLWGGCTPFGIDCSGFTQLSYKLSGMQLLRDASLQFQDRRFRPVEAGKPFAEAELAAGDLVTFHRKQDGPITHIGMALGDGRFLHSSGGRGVHIDPCDTPRYVEMYAGAIRISPDADLAIEAA